MTEDIQLPPLPEPTFGVGGLKGWEERSVRAYARAAVLADRERGKTTKAAQDVLAERQRQIEREGWTPEHDDKHNKGEMALVAACSKTVWKIADEGRNLWPTVYEKALADEVVLFGRACIEAYVARREKDNLCGLHPAALAIDTALVNSGLDCPPPDCTDWDAQVRRLLDWTAAVALDPAVSAEARALVERGRKHALKPFHSDTSEACPCRWCDKPTAMLGTQMCDACWELERRIFNSPVIAARMLVRLRS